METERFYDAPIPQQKMKKNRLTNYGKKEKKVSPVVIGNLVENLTQVISLALVLVLVFVIYFFRNVIQDVISHNFFFFFEMVIRRGPDQIYVSPEFACYCFSQQYKI